MWSCGVSGDLAEAFAGVAGAADEFGLSAAWAGGDFVSDEVVEFFAGLALGPPGFGYSRQRAAEVIHDR